MSSRDLAGVSSASRARVTVLMPPVDQELPNPKAVANARIKNSQSPAPLKQLSKFGAEPGGSHARQWKQFNVK